jgi:hypothetical protein
MSGDLRVELFSPEHAKRVFPHQLHDAAGSVIIVITSQNIGKISAFIRFATLRYADHYYPRRINCCFDKHLSAPTPLLRAVTKYICDS